jgi:hypothetical protein
MRRWEVLQQAIGRGRSEDVAELLGRSAEQVRRWQREPFGDDSPTSTGYKSPLDGFCELLQAVQTVNPQGAEMIVDFVRDFHRRLRGGDVALIEATDLVEELTSLRNKTNQVLMRLTADGRDER